LKSGLLLITGPHKLNGVPLRRVNQAYVIATSTRVTVPFHVPDALDDSYFRKPKTKRREEKKEKKKDDFSQTLKYKRKKLPGKVKNVQKAFDKPIIAEIKKTPYLSQYLKTRFSLLENQFPHLMKF